MPTIEAFLTSIQDAVTCIEARLRRDWPADDDERADVSARLQDIEYRLWRICEVEK